MATIENETFTYCNALASVTFGSGVSSIGTNVFYGCPNLTTITVDGANTTFDSRDNCNAVIATASNTLVLGCQGTTIPSTVTAIGDKAFENCEGLTSITIPTSVTSIGRYAFHACEALASITFDAGSKLTTIGDYAFLFCSGLTSVTIPDGVTFIGSVAFAYTKLASITLPASVTTIGSNAFNCSTLNTATIGAASQTKYDYPFNDYDENLVINVPAGSLDEYAAGYSNHATQLQATWTGKNITSGDFAGYWSTYYNNGCAVQVDENTRIYYISAVGSNTATLTENTTDKVITQGQAVLLKSTAADVTMSYSSAASACSYTSNQLQGVDAATTISESDYSGNSIYTLANADGLGFYKYTGTTLGANKAFLPLSTASVKGFTFTFEVPTSLTPVPSPKGEGSSYYDLNGRRVSQPKKGLYIVNGKKVMAL
ncbi:MAG: leucine-rich repeat domain-containing protein [Bacteroidaceae bacterium]|nr:leucine-rich repeat domain-containing protein [Bacteroidaceae bacterium]